MFHYADVRYLVEDAKNEGIEARVLFARQSARDMLISDTSLRRVRGVAGKQAPSLAMRLIATS